MSVTQPEFFVPVHGEYRHMANHVRLAAVHGAGPGQGAAVRGRGRHLGWTPRASHRDGSVPAGYLFVDGSSVGDIGHGVLRDRMVLAEEGVVMAVATVDRQEGILSCPPVIETRGWVHAAEAEALLGEASDVVGAAVTKALKDGAHDIEGLNRHTRKALGKFVGDRTRRRPMIVPVVLMV